MSLSNVVLQDPVLAIELGAVALTFLYIARLSLNPLGTFNPVATQQSLLQTFSSFKVPAIDDAGCLYIGFSKKQAERSRTRTRSFKSLFGVGELISLPKRSLLKQKTRNYYL